MAILQKKASTKICATTWALHRLYTSNIEEIGGALIRAVAYISISGLSMTVENITPVLNPPTEKIRGRPDAILMVVADAFNISIQKTSKVHHGDREISWAYVKLLCAWCAALHLWALTEDWWDFGWQTIQVLYELLTKLPSCRKADLTLAKRCAVWQIINRGRSRKIPHESNSSSEPAVLQACKKKYKSLNGENGLWKTNFFLWKTFKNIFETRGFEWKHN